MHFEAGRTGTMVKKKGFTKRDQEILSSRRQALIDVMTETDTSVADLAIEWAKGNGGKNAVSRLAGMRRKNNWTAVTKTVAQELAPLLGCDLARLLTGELTSIEKSEVQEAPTQAGKRKPRKKTRKTRRKSAGATKADEVVAITEKKGTKKALGLAMIDIGDIVHFATDSFVEERGGKFFASLEIEEIEISPTTLAMLLLKRQ